MSDFTVIMLKFLVTALIAGALAGAMNAARAERSTNLTDAPTLYERIGAAAGKSY